MANTVTKNTRSVTTHTQGLMAELAENFESMFVDSEEEVMRLHREVMRCRELEESIGIATQMLRGITLSSCAYLSRPFFKSDESTLVIDTDIFGSLVEIGKSCRRMETTIGHFETKGYVVEGARSFRGFCRVIESHIAAMERKQNGPLNPRLFYIRDGQFFEEDGTVRLIPGAKTEDVLAGIQEAEEGKGISLEEYMALRASQ